MGGTLTCTYYEKEIDEQFGEDADWGSEEIRTFISNYNDTHTNVLIHFTYNWGLDANLHIPNGLFSDEAEVIVNNDNNTFYKVISVREMKGYTYILVRPVY